MQRTTRTYRALLAGISLPLGVAAIAASIPEHAPTQAVAGLALILAGITSYALNVIDRAVRDTSHERDRLQEELKATQAERMRCVVARAFVDREAEQLCQKMELAEQETAVYLATQTARIMALAAAEREELLADVEDRESSLKREGFLRGLDAGIRGIALPSSAPTAGAVVIQMPRAAIGSKPNAAGHGAHTP